MQWEIKTLKGIGKEVKSNTKKFPPIPDEKKNITADPGEKSEVFGKYAQ